MCRDELLAIVREASALGQSFGIPKLPPSSQSGRLSAFQLSNPMALSRWGA